jgi:competence protein ComEC
LRRAPSRVTRGAFSHDDTSREPDTRAFVSRLAAPPAMNSPASLVALVVLLGAVTGARFPLPLATRWFLLPILIATFVCWRQKRARLQIACVAAGFALAACVLARAGVESALQSPLRTYLEERYGHFAVTTLARDPTPEPILTRFEILEDAAAGDDAVLVRVAVLAVRSGATWRSLPREGVRLTIGGVSDALRFRAWRAGRIAIAPITYRRPARYLDEGVEDGERELLLGGITLFGSVKSGLLVDIVQHGSAIREAAAAVRAHVRRAVERFVGRRDPIAAAIVTAVLIGDRTALPDEVRTRLQAAGTYHVIAISGGNIALVAALTLGCLFVMLVPRRIAALLTIGLLAFHAEIVTSGPSVWRATIMAIVYLAARTLDQRTPPTQSIAIAAVLLVLARPLDVSDPGFILTFGATTALLEGGRRSQSLLQALSHRATVTPRWRVAWRLVVWAGMSIAASLAVETALLPVSAQLFSRVSLSGVVLNLLAVPLMAIVQIGGTMICAMSAWPPVARAAGTAAMWAAEGIVNSARLVDVVPALAPRVPAPGAMLVLAYYLGLFCCITSRRFRIAGALVVTTAAFAIVSGMSISSQAARTPSDFRLTMIDVGQGESMLLEAPDAPPLLVDAGGAPFGTSGDEIGMRVVTPALWARGVGRLGGLLVTHGDPDHVGGAQAVVRDFSPPQLWLGVPVPTHIPTRELMRREREVHGTTEWLRRGTERAWGRARIRVLHPPEPDWERPRVRNDDSIVIEVSYGDVAMLLTGDISEEVERTLIPQLTPSRIRVLKVAHHGSRTSSSSALLDAWHPHVALISCGRGNRFGHPTTEVLDRLTAAGARVYRTDIDGEITLLTDGHDLRVTTWIGR